MIKNILVVRNDRFGEFLLIIPALQLLKELYPDAKLILAVGASVKEIAALIECVDKVLIWDEAKKDLRRHRFDIAVIFNPTKEAHVSTFLAGISIRIGYNRKWGFLLTHKIKDTKHLGNRHEVICNLELVEYLRNKGQSPSLDFARDRSGTVTGFSLNVPGSGKYDSLSGAVAIHSFTSDPVKQWPIERFGELVDKISQELNTRVVLIGKNVEGDTLQGRVSPSSTSSNIINLINKTSLVELAQVLKQCKLLITCDSGPMHLAATVGTPVVALFRNDLPGKTSKRWGPWGEGHKVIESGSLEDIKVDEVLREIKDRLQLGTAP